MILVMVPGAHLHKQAREDDNTNGFGGSALLFIIAVIASRLLVARQSKIARDTFTATSWIASSQALLAMTACLGDAKRQARAAAIARRAACDPAVGAQLAQRVLAACIIPPGAIVAGFWPLAGEIDIRPLLIALSVDHTMALPSTPPLGQPLNFHHWQPGDPLHEGRFGTMAPGGPEITPTVLLVPLLAFDRRGNRLGYGAGYYDRTLAGLPGALAIGCAFAAQETGVVPSGPTDVPLHFIATERGVLRI